jgi:DNA-binding MarR family transcriptional regulator
VALPRSARASRSIRRRWDVRSSAADRASAADRVFAIEESLGYLINRAARAMAYALGQRLRDHGVQIGQWAVLMFLWAEDGRTQAELSRVVAIEPATMVRTLDRMARDGLVRREPDRRDRRLIRIRLTPQGAALRDVLVPEAVAVNAQVARGMSAREQMLLRELLRRLISLLIATDEPHMRGAR